MKTEPTPSAIGNVFTCVGGRADGRRIKFDKPRLEMWVRSFVKVTSPFGFVENESECIKRGPMPNKVDFDTYRMRFIEDGETTIKFYGHTKLSDNDCLDLLLKNYNPSPLSK